MQAVITDHSSMRPAQSGMNTWSCLRLNSPTTVGVESIGLHADAAGAKAMNKPPQSSPGSAVLEQMNKVFGPRTTVPAHV